MKVFLLSDLVVHELVSMQLDGKWLTFEQFVESARLWASRNGLKNQLSKELLDTLQHEAILIAERLIKDVRSGEQDSPLKRLLLDIPAVNYADPLSASALAASLEVCRKNCGPCRDRNGAAAERKTGWACHPTLRLLLCGVSTPRERAHEPVAVAVSPRTRARDE